MSVVPQNEKPQMSLEDLKAKAALLGIEHSPNIGANTLQEKINVRMGELKIEAESKKAIEASKLTLQQKAMKMVRVLITPNDPTYEDRDGIFLVTGNSDIASDMRQAPFNVPWLIPEVFYQQIKAMQYQHFKKKVKGFGGQLTNLEQEVEGVWRPSFNVQLLDMISDDEISEIQKRQQARGAYAED